MNLSRRWRMALFWWGCSWGAAVYISALSPNELSCIRNVVEEYRNETLVFFAGEIGRTENEEAASKLLKNQDQAKKIISDGDQVEQRGFYVLFPSKEWTSYSKLLNSITHHSLNRFLIVWPNLHDFERIKLVMDEFWTYRVLNVIVLTQNASDSELIYAYSYQPYTDLSCDQATIQQIDIWTGEIFSRGAKLYDSTGYKLKNLHGCTLKCFVRIRPPDSIRYKNRKGAGSVEWAGVGGKLLNVAKKRMNFNVSVTFPQITASDEYGYDRSQNVPRLVATLLDEFDVDFGFGIYTHLVYGHKKTELSHFGTIECLTFTVATNSGTEIPPWQYYTKVFSNEIWYLIFCFFTLYTVLCYVETATSRNDFGKTVLLLFSMQIGVPITWKYVGWRLSVIPILLYSTIVVCVYQSCLGSFLLVPWQRRQVQSYKEVIQRGFKIITMPVSYEKLRQFVAYSPELGELKNRFYLNDKENMTLVLEDFLSNVNERLNVLKDCLIRTPTAPFVFKRGSPFVDPINDIISRMTESGITSKWYAQYTPKIKKRTYSVRALDLNKFKAAFSILIVGGSAALLAFLAELVNFKTRLRVNNSNFI